MKDIVIKKPKQKRSQEKFDAILDALPSTIKFYGFKKTTTAKIALEANVGMSTVYDYFSCKEAIIFAYLDDRLDQAMEAVSYQAKYSTKGPEETMKAFIRAGLSFANQNRDLIKVVLSEFPNDLDKINFTRSKEKIKQIGIDFAMRQNISIPAENLPLTIYALTNIIVSFQIRSIIAPEKNLDDEIVADELTKIISSYTGLY